MGAAPRGTIADLGGGFLPPKMKYKIYKLNGNIIINAPNTKRIAIIFLLLYYIYLLQEKYLNLF